MAIIPGEMEKNIVVSTPERRKANNLLMIFGVIIVLTAIVIYFGFLNSPAPAQPGTAAQPGVVNITASAQQQINQSVKILEALKTTYLNNQIFTDKRFESLVLSDRLPVTVGDKGRVNPFAPF